MEIVPVEAPDVQKREAEYQKRYAASDPGKARKRNYRSALKDSKFWRPIVAIDGEGITRDDGSHAYIMLGISGEKTLMNRSHDGLSTKQIFDWLYDHLSTDNLNVIFYGQYDFNMWLKGTDHETLARIYRATDLSEQVVLHGYRVRWRKGKSFDLSRRSPLGKWQRLRIVDVGSNFQCPFVNALDQYFPEGYDGRDELVVNKAARGSFEADSWETIEHYMQQELRLLVDLQTRVREYTDEVGLRPNAWDGPGGFVTALFQREGLKEHMAECPPAVQSAARYAYAGGRFEMLRYGKSNERVYEYDINSAYPTALTQLPSLSGGEWTYHRGDPGDVQFALYKVRSKATNPHIPGPVLVRNYTGTIAYPLSAENWIWSPEMQVLREYHRADPDHQFEVVEAWTFKPAPGKPKPFAFVNKIYAERQNMKAAGIGAQMILKLCLNSLYGKTAQRKGAVFNPRTGKWNIPPYHQLEWAGWVTSWCRAKVLTAALEKPDAIIAFETDALFSSEPLDLPVGEGLGAWECTEFDSLTYVQSGVYFGTVWNAKKEKWEEVVKCRGVDRGEVTRDMVEGVLHLPQKERVLLAPLTRFYGAGIALMRNDDVWCKWITTEKEVKLYPSGKRIHVGCLRCTFEDPEYGSGGLLEGWHETICPPTPADGIVDGYATSNEYPIPWINPNPIMAKLDELSDTERDYGVYSEE